MKKNSKIRHRPLTLVALIRRLALGFISSILIALISYGAYWGYQANLTYNGYCRTENKYLTDDEKIKAAVSTILKIYPPAVIRTQDGPHDWTLSAPKHPIYYRDLNEFFSVNSDCCEITKTRNSEEGIPTFMERLTGTVSAYMRINYEVRYVDSDGIQKSIPSSNHIPISNCGKPARKWQPGDYFFEFHPSNFDN